MNGDTTQPTTPMIQARPVPGMNQIRTFAQAVLIGKYVLADIIATRLQACRECEKRRITAAGVEWCGLCGCKVAEKSRQIDNLAAYEENLPRWGCKHPQRGQGKGWPIES